MAAFGEEVRMRRMGLKLAFGVSLALCGVVAAVWVYALAVAPAGGGYRGWIVGEEAADGSHWIVGVSGTGRLMASHQFPLPQRYQGMVVEGTGRARPEWRLLPGVGRVLHDVSVRRTDGTVVRHTTARVTHAHLAWPLLLGAALPAGLWARRWLGKRRALARSGQGRCAACGYDLRATPEQCPECGAPAAAAAR